MSGPMAAGYGIDAAVLVSAQSIVTGAAEIAADLAEADRQAQATRAQRRHERQQLRAARQAGIDKRRQEAADRSTRLQRLHDVLKGLDPTAADIALPAAIDATLATDAAAHATHIAALDARIAQLETRLRQHASALPADGRSNLDTLLAAGVSAQEQLAAYLAQARLAGATADIVAAREQLVAHVLERLHLDADARLPEALDRLAAAVVQAPTQDRAEALATELRLQVHTHNQNRAAATEQAQLQAAAALVLEQSLKDLGYAVEEIEETLFVDGGVAHFQRPDWGDYHVRMRVDPQRQTLNFNVVRAGTANADRRHEDMMAEERWCAAFPRLFETLKARGIPITVTRLLQAGEAPVQVVDVASLPARGAEEYRHAPLKARSIE